MIETGDGPRRAIVEDGPWGSATVGRQWPQVAFALLALGLILHVTLPTTADPDLWGHLRYGLDNLAAGRILRTDAYSYLTEPGTWVNHEWLAEVAMARAYQLGDQMGLVLYKLALTVASMAALYAAARLRGAGVAAASVVCLVATLALRPILDPVRPQLFTVFGFSTLLLILAARERHPGAVWWLLPLYVMWTNAHGGFIAGIAFLGFAVLLVAGQSLSTRNSVRAWLRTPDALLAGVALVTLAATIVNPYGLGLWRFLLETATVPRPEIVDWQPLAGFPHLLALAGALGLLGAWLLYRSPRPRSMLFLSLYAVSAAMAIVAVRHLLFFAIAWAVAHAEHLDAYGAWLLRPLRRARWLPGASRWVLAGMTALVWVSLLAQGSSIHIPPGTYPVRAVELVNREVSGGRLVTPFSWGQYALWHLGPDIRVSMDGRRETVYTEATYRANLGHLTGTGDWSALLRNGAPDLVLTDKGFASHNLMLLHPDWQLVYEDPLCGLFAPRGSTTAAHLSQSLPPSVPYDGYSWRFP